MRSEMQIDRERFLRACNSSSFEAQGKIGELKEKSLHRALKHYFEPDPLYHEISFCGSVADIKNDEGVIEIQTRSFDKLIPKLERFLPETSVTIVYPIVERKTVSKVNVISGEGSSPRRSPKRGRSTDALAEIAKIRNYIPDERIKIVLVFLDAMDLRLEGGSVAVGRKRTAKIDTIPTSLNSIIVLREADDYRLLLPPGLSDEFTAAEFEKISRLHKINLHNSLMLLLRLGILQREKQGRRYIYSIQPKV